MTDGVKWVVGGILAILVIASITIRLLPHKADSESYIELKRRVQSWWVMVFIFVGALVIDRRLSVVVFAFISFLALKEYVSAIPTRRVDRRALFWAYLSIPVQYYWAGTGYYGMFIIFIPVYLFLLIPLRLVLAGETKGFLRAAGTLHWGLMVTVFSLSHGAFLLSLKDGPALLLYLVVLTQSNDVAQFISGKSFGKRKIVPRVSPNKTWGGFIGGVIITSCLAMALAPLLTPLTLGQSAIAGVIIAVGGFFGDLTVSAVKRDLGIKDMGATIPGHGGVMDRVDSLTYTAPLFFHLIYYLHF
ncbi:MAG: phosphatidate cytidylyltransferase [Verrucomicrobiales bacterium]|nr:phosphatidate cytidylyltransferase [Verrucomicrobiae bacterium]